MDKISLNVTDSVYGSKHNACNSLHTISLHNGVVFLEGAQVTKNGRNQVMIPTFFYARRRPYLLSVTTCKAPYTILPKSPLGQAVAHYDDYCIDRVSPAQISTWEHPHNAIVTLVNRDAIFSSFVFVFVYGKTVFLSYTNCLVNIFNSTNYNQQISKHL